MKNSYNYKLTTEYIFYLMLGTSGRYHRAYIVYLFTHIFMNLGVWYTMTSLEIGLAQENTKIASHSI